MSQQMRDFTAPENATKYEILGVDRQATDDELRVAYRRLALLYHPDRHAEEHREAAGQIFARIASAYTTLSDPETRRRYDIALSRNEEYRENKADANVISLVEILAGIGAYEHMFSEDSVANISGDLDYIVQRNLIDQLGEEIVEAWPLPAAPSGEKHTGTFSKGALVLTNLRVLLPYTFTWQQTHSNVRTTYKGAGMPTLPLPMLDHIAVIVEKRIKRRLFLDFHFKGEKIRITPRRTNLSKLLLLAQLWGVPIEARQEDAKWAELRWALWQPWLMGLIVLAVLFAGAGILGLFGDGVVDNMADLSDFFRRWGVLEWSTVAISAICGQRLMRWVLAYSAFDLADSLQASNPDTTSRPGHTTGTAASHAQ
jgi:DnaJ-domain-containing protein 1